MVRGDTIGFCLVSSQYIDHRKKEKNGAHQSDCENVQTGNRAWG